MLARPRTLPGMTEEHQELMSQAIAADGEAQRALLSGEGESARRALRRASELYRSSWEAAGPRAYGRLVGMLKAAVLAGGGEEEAEYTQGQIQAADSAPAAYALALAALVLGEDANARAAAAGMRGASEAFDRTGEALDALAARDAARYAEALRAIVADFEAREEHLTGVAFADTALVLERLAAPRGLAARLTSPVLP